MILKDLNIALATKILKTLSTYLYFSPKWVHIEYFDKTQYISFLIKYDELSVKYNEIWEKLKK